MWDIRQWDKTTEEQKHQEKLSHSYRQNIWVMDSISRTSIFFDIHKMLAYLVVIYYGLHNWNSEDHSDSILRRLPYSCMSHLKLYVIYLNFYICSVYVFNVSMCFVSQSFVKGKKRTLILFLFTYFVLVLNCLNVIIVFIHETEKLVNIKYLFTTE